MSKKTRTRTKKITLVEALLTGVMALAMAAVSYLITGIYIAIIIALIGSIVLFVRLIMGLPSPIGLVDIAILFSASLVAILIYNLIYTRVNTGKWRLSWRAFYLILMDSAAPGV